MTRATFRAANLHLQRWATSRYRNAVTRGEMESQPCVICGKKAEGHHEDYAEPLEVIWLCRFHHSHRHQGATVEEMHGWYRGALKEAA